VEFTFTLEFTFSSQQRIYLLFLPDTPAKSAAGRFFWERGKEKRNNGSRNPFSQRSLSPLFTYF